MAVTVEALTVVHDEIVEAFDRLLPKLSSTARRLDRDALAQLISAESTTVLVARVSGKIVGTKIVGTLRSRGRNRPERSKIAPGLHFLPVWRGF
ncbi:hypothetical protein [Nocardia sp. NBC_01388]|uniref:hypothetical protein n=1 Tax=Nocardia sp. NBC_01388 TaxID=2903596 RepID=UPI00324AA7ED